MAGRDPRPIGCPAGWRFDSVFDGGDTGCGELLIDLRLFLRALADARTVAVIARDPGAPMEIPAWCRMTGRRLVAAEHPHYLIETNHP